MSAALPHDLALSSTHNPTNNTSYSVFYGCNANQMREIEASLRSATNDIDHPLLCLGIFAELERRRLVNLAEDLVDSFTIDSEMLENKYSDLNSLKMRESLAICLRSRTLVDQIRSFKRQLNKVLDEIDLLAREDGRCAAFLETGTLIKRRINDMADEYEDKIDECNMMAENLSLAMQTVSPYPPVPGLPCENVLIDQVPVL